MVRLVDADKAIEKICRLNCAYPYACGRGAECYLVRAVNEARSEDCDNFRNAIEKAKPLKVLYESDGFADGAPVYDMAVCPSCDYRYEEYDMAWGEPFCPHCGQALDWNMTYDDDATEEEKSCGNCKHFIGFGDGWHQCNVSKVCGAHSEWTPRQSATKDGEQID